MTTAEIQLLKERLDCGSDGMSHYCPNCGSTVDRDRKLRGALDLLTQVVGQTAWRTMDSAPKDGTRFLLSWGYDQPVMGWAEGDDFYYLDNQGKRHKVTSLPHWMPLPPLTDAGESK